jgi:GT2 family glycosyltransferase
VPPGRHATRVRRHLAAAGTPATVRPSPLDGDVLRVEWPVPDRMTLGVVVPTRDNPADLSGFLASLRRAAARPGTAIVVVDNGSGSAAASALAETAGQHAARLLRIDEPFNWSRLCGLGAAALDTDVLLFANDDMLMLSPGWDERVLGQMARAEIGVLGGRLLYPDRRIQHAGMLMGWRGGTIHDGRDAPATDPGPERRWNRPRRVAAVTGAFLATPRTLFERLGGFDAAPFPVGFGDVDYCFRVREAGFVVLYDPEIELIHHESRSRGADHADPVRAARADAELAAFRDRWGATALADPGINPAWADFGRPLQHLRAPSAEALQRYLERASGRDPWTAARAQAER